MDYFSTYAALPINGAQIGLEWGSDEPSFCTPVGAEIFATNNGIQFCLVPEYGEMVFAVDGDACGDALVFPLAQSFADFFRLILACGNTAAIEQIQWWTRETFDQYLATGGWEPDCDLAPSPEELAAEKASTQAVLDTIAQALDLTPMPDPFDYVKALQATFDDSKLVFSHDYYDCLGLEDPNDPDTPCDS